MVPQIVVGPGHLDLLTVNIATSTAIEQGDLISYESALAVLLDANTEDATFLGYAFTSHFTDQAEPDKLVVALAGIVTYDCTSASTYALADKLAYDNATENTLVESGSNTIAWVAKTPIGTVTRVDALINVLAVQKLFVAAA